MNYEEKTTEILEILDEVMDDYNLSIPVDASDELEYNLPTLLQDEATTTEIVEEIKSQLRENGVDLFDDSARADSTLFERILDIIDT